jgi:hypothetical protein
MKGRSTIVWIITGAAALLGILTTLVYSQSRNLQDNLSSKCNPHVQASKPRLAQNYGGLPFNFGINKGQTHPQVKFLSRGRCYTTLLAGDEEVLSLIKPSAAGRHLPDNRELPMANRLLWPATINGPPTSERLHPSLIRNSKSEVNPNPNTSPNSNPEQISSDVVRIKRSLGQRPSADGLTVGSFPVTTNPQSIKGRIDSTC